MNVMIIQHNISAMNANRQLNITGGALTKSTRNLSSGYKINVAADDAAGLSISEKMRRQIRGLTQGVQNTEDGVSLCQVADGALSEVQDMLQRINELAVQAANGTNSESDRSHINDEVTQLLTEIDRIGDTTKFNEVFIFKGTDKLTREKWVTIGGNSSIYRPQIIPTPPFSEMTMDCELTEGPFGANNNGNQLALAARSTNPGATGRWNLIYGSGGTSYPKLVGSYYNATTSTTVNFTMNLRDIRPTSYAASNITATGEKEWSRTFTYNGQNGFKIELTQTVTLGNKDTDSQYYTVGYKVKNIGTVDLDSYSLIHHEDTAYNNNDRDETYHIQGGQKLTTTTMYINNAADPDNIDYYNSFNGNAHVTSSIPSSFSIILNENGQPKALSFTENIQIGSGAGAADALIIGNYSQIGQLPDYTSETTNAVAGTLGQNANRMDLGFSLVWRRRSLAAGDPSADFSFKQGIVMTEKDPNIPKDTQKLPTVNIAPPAPKPVPITKDYIGGNHQLWVQSGGEALDGMVLKINSMNTGVLDIDDISTLAEWTSDDAIDRISIALSEISKQRSLIGAYQNRLEHTIANEDNIVENTTAAESQIRDTDMAKEMVEYSNKNILMQAGQAMLSQANQSTQGVLSLIAA